jgi:hypothetical protein
MANHPTRLAPVAVVIALLLAGCGGSGGGDASDEKATTDAEPAARLVKAGLRAPAGCFITVFLREDVTPAQKREVQLLMLSSGRIATVAFVSKALSLERLRAVRPKVARSLRVNPYPPQFEVVPRSKLHVFAIITDLAAGIEGVTNARASRPCASAD